MELITISFEDWSNLYIHLNLLAIIFVLGIAILLSLILRFSTRMFYHRSIFIDEVTLGIGSTSVKLTYDRTDQAIAYKLWVEMSTRKIGIPFHMEDDVIVEVYNSWYEFFRVSRDLLKSLPESKLATSTELISLTERVLNDGLRPHLTHWQARFRKWYDQESDRHPDLSPQTLQRRFSEYSELVEDLVATNQCMIAYKELMKDIAFGKRHSR